VVEASSAGTIEGRSAVWMMTVLVLVDLLPALYKTGHSGSVATAGVRHGLTGASLSVIRRHQHPHCRPDH
jgi:hypothetical protein